VWARVISRPEPGLALLDAGKRDVGVDEGLPQVQAVRPGGSGDTEELQGAVVVAVNDQHTHVRLTGAAELVQVGDVLRLGVSHPCTTFDKWQLLPVVDDAGARQPVVVDLLRTVFG
jgi:D-serine deaminase-like pyridoxal phosphate-dependent protein